MHAFAMRAFAAAQFRCAQVLLYWVSEVGRKGVLPCTLLRRVRHARQPHACLRSRSRSCQPAAAL
jgi:hypothetical protein